MALVIPFHARVSATSRAANRASKSAFTPAPRASSVVSTEAHQSAGIRSRCAHLRTAGTPAPIAAAIASGEGQSPMIARNELIASMSDALGQFVLKSKPNLSYDCEFGTGHNVLMAKPSRKAQFRVEFAAKVKAAREKEDLSQAQVARALGIRQDKYKHYELDRYLPHEYIEAFCLVCHISPEFLYPHARQSKRAKPAA